MEKTTYQYWEDGSILAIEDMLGEHSVTAELEAVLLEIEQKIGSLKNRIIVYRDTQGIWDGVTRRPSGLVIFNLNVTTYEQVQQKIRQFSPAQLATYSS